MSQSLHQSDNFITKLNYLPSQLKGVVSEKEYVYRMTQFQQVLSEYTGHKVPLLIAFAYWVAGIAIDIIWEWFGFFMIMLPAVSYFVSAFILTSQYKSRVEGVFQSWKNVKATFSTNVVKGDYALLELKAQSLPGSGIVGIEYGGSMESEVAHQCMSNEMDLV